MSFLGLLLTGWLLLIIWLAVKLSSPGHALFKDHRIGKDGKEIHVYKFRSMYSDAETNIDKYLNRQQKKEWKKERKVKNDPRITPVGRFLRKTSLDELPQLFNILFGSMTIVGPRPITQKELDLYFTEDEKKILLSARPGLIGYWGVMGRSNVEFNSGRQKLELDYFKLRGLWFDLRLMFRVIPSVIKGDGAR